MAQGITTYDGGSMAAADTIDAAHNPKDATRYFNDHFFTSATTAHNYTLTAGTLTRSASYQNGVLSLASSTADAHAYSVAPMLKPTAGRIYRAEARVAWSTIAASGAGFWGFSSTSGTIPLTTAGTGNGTQDYIGFSVTTTALFMVVADGATITKTQVSGVTVAAATFLRLGMVIDGTGSVAFYVDGNKVGTITSGITTDALYESFGTVYATADKTTLIDYVDVTCNVRS